MIVALSSGGAGILWTGLWYVPHILGDKLYVRAEIFEGQFYATPKAIKNKNMKKNQNARASLNNFIMPLCS